jgi:nitrogen fixation NifU-like protein
MSTELRDLYQEIILDHSRQPRNFGVLAEANRSARGYNPLCGDQLTLYLKVEDDIVQDARFEGAGCAISTASASVMTEVLKGKRVTEIETLFDGMIELLTSDVTEPVSTDLELGKLAAFSGVREYPMRVKCATLAWHTLRAALEDGASEEPVATE